MGRKKSKPMVTFDESQWVVVDDVDQFDAHAAVVTTEVLGNRNTEVASEDDTWAAVAARFAPKGMTKHEYAKQLYETNKGRQIREGMEIKL
jgi:hypothetical protein